MLTILRHYTSTDLSADQIHELGLQALDRIHTEMRTLFDQLGYPADESLPELLSALQQIVGAFPGMRLSKAMRTSSQQSTKILETLSTCAPT